MSEFFLGHDPGMSQYARVDEDGFTVRTRFHDTEEILDDNQRRRSIDPKPRAITKDGVCWRHVGSIPMELMHKWCKELGRWPDREFILEKLKNPDYRKLLVTEERF